MKLRVFIINICCEFKCGIIWKKTMNKLIYTIWMLLTVSITFLVVFCVFQPAWYIHENHTHSFGLTTFCEGLPANDQSASEHVNKRIKQNCYPYGRTFDIKNIPSGAWQASFLMMITGAFAFAASIVLGLLVLCVSKPAAYNITSLVLYLQTSAVLLTIAALLTYPIGLTSHYFQYFCGEEATVYSPGNCSIGWTYMLSIMTSSISIFCPVLWCFRETRWNEFQFKEYV